MVFKLVTVRTRFDRGLLFNDRAEIQHLISKDLALIMGLLKLRMTLTVLLFNLVKPLLERRQLSAGVFEAVDCVARSWYLVLGSGAEKTQEPA